MQINRQGTQKNHSSVGSSSIAPAALAIVGIAVVVIGSFIFADGLKSGALAIESIEVLGSGSFTILSGMATCVMGYYLKTLHQEDKNQIDEKEKTPDPAISTHQSLIQRETDHKPTELDNKDQWKVTENEGLEEKFSQQGNEYPGLVNGLNGMEEVQLVNEPTVGNGVQELLNRPKELDEGQVLIKGTKQVEDVQLVNNSDVVDETQKLVGGSNHRIIIQIDHEKQILQNEKWKQLKDCFNMEKPDFLLPYSFLCNLLSSEGNIIDWTLKKDTNNNITHYSIHFQNDRVGYFNGYTLKQDAVIRGRIERKTNAIYFDKGVLASIYWMFQNWEYNKIKICEKNKQLYLCVIDLNYAIPIAEDVWQKIQWQQTS